MALTICISSFGLPSVRCFLCFFLGKVGKRMLSHLANRFWFKSRTSAIYKVFECFVSNKYYSTLNLHSCTTDLFFIETMSGIWIDYLTVISIFSINV